MGKKITIILVVLMWVLLGVFYLSSKMSDEVNKEVVPVEETEQTVETTEAQEVDTEEKPQEYLVLKTKRVLRANSRIYNSVLRYEYLTEKPVGDYITIEGNQTPEDLMSSLNGWVSTVDVGIGEIILKSNLKSPDQVSEERKTSPKYAINDMNPLLYSVDKVDVVAIDEFKGASGQNLMKVYVLKSGLDLSVSQDGNFITFNTERDLVDFENLTKRKFEIVSSLESFARQNRLSCFNGECVGLAPEKEEEEEDTGIMSSMRNALGGQ